MTTGRTFILRSGFPFFTVAITMSPMQAEGNESHIAQLQVSKLLLKLTEQAVTDKVVISEVLEIILRCVSRDEAALAVAQKVFKGLYDNASNCIHVGAHLGILIEIRDVCKLKF
ncbi:hypothetical protein RIF29_20381 [Crotalaria pallida]|uniref:CCR4-NOT transcription complex subunit 1-like NOT1 connector domain-containing protein n=1 Tax=Crotalaria pallida TaxID=3830 RepID=A0AAN9F5E8_CROPI